MIGALKLIFGRFAGGTKPDIPGREGMLACRVPGGAPPTPGGGGRPGVPGAPVPGGMPKEGGRPGGIPIPPMPGMPGIEGKPGGIWGRPYSARVRRCSRENGGVDLRPYGYMVGEL